jgi:DNA (cytosine-5)-methyltransferase 1
LFFTVIDLIRNTEERDRPEWLIAENVMGLFSSNRGYDFLAAQIALDEVGYDVEWEVFNATQFGIQQNRQRVFIVGHSRRHGRREVFPLGDDATEAIDAFGDETVYHYHSKDGTMREFSGVTPTLTGYMGTGGNNVPLVEGQQKQLMWTDGGLGHAIQVKCDITPPIRAQGGGSTPGIFVSAVLTPDREEKRQNGRRFKDVGEPMFTLTAQDKRGVMVIQKTHGATTTVNYDKTGTLQAARLDKIPCIPVVKNHGEWPERETAQSRIRKLTPLECWRLMGRTDADFHAARIAGVSDTQLYKQAGNSLVPQIAEAIGRAIL